MTSKPIPIYGDARCERSLPGPGAPLLIPKGPYNLVISGAPCELGGLFARQLVRRALTSIAVDSGAGHFLAANIAPSVLVGDMDSVSAEALAFCEARDSRIEACDWQKDETDLELALRLLDDVATKTPPMPSGPSNAESATAPDAKPMAPQPYTLVCCATGGRADHELAAIGALAARPAQAPVIADAQMLIVFLCANGARPRIDLCELGCAEGTTLSIIALSQPAKVSAIGLRWNLESAQLSPLSGRGVSNYVMNPDCAAVSCEEGAALVMVLR